MTTNENTATPPTIDGMRIRAMMFDEERIPEFAFLTTEEVCAAFGIEDRTLRKWREKGEFPEPTKLPGMNAYPISAIREYLRHLSNQAKKATRELLK